MRGRANRRRCLRKKATGKLTSGGGTRSTPPPETATTNPSVLTSSSTTWVSPDQTAAAPAPRPETRSSPANWAAAQDTFDHLLDPSDRTLLPREAESGGSQLRSEEEWGARQATAGNAAPEAGLTRRTRRFLALTAASTLIAQATAGAFLELGSSMGQAIGTAVFGAVALLIEGPEITKTLRETRRKRSTKSRVRKRAHGE